MKTTSIAVRRFAWGASLVALAMILALAFSPTARAYAQTLIQQIGSLLISHEPTYAEQFERKINSETPTISPTASPVAVEWQAPPSLSLTEACSQAGFPVVEIGHLPPGLMLAARFVSPPDEANPFTRVTTTYTSSDMSLVFSQTAYQPGSAQQHLPAGEATVVPVIVQGMDGLWIENLRLSTYLDENDQVVPQYANILIWEKGGFEYSLQTTPGLPQEEMLVLACSIDP